MNIDTTIFFGEKQIHNLMSYTLDQYDSSFGKFSLQLGEDMKFRFVSFCGRICVLKCLITSTIDVWQKAKHSMDCFLWRMNNLRSFQDWQWIKAHRFVLAAGSTFFRRLLEEDQGVPFVYKTNNTFEELRALLDVLYLGRIPARNYVESTKLREMVFPYGVDCARPVFFNDVVQYHKLGGIATAAATVTAISEESLNS